MKIIMRINHIQEMVKIMIMIIKIDLEEEEIIMDKIIKMTHQKIEKMKKMEILIMTKIIIMVMNMAKIMNKALIIIKIMKIVILIQQIVKKLLMKMILMLKTNILMV